MRTAFLLLVFLFFPLLLHADGPILYRDATTKRITRGVETDIDDSGNLDAHTDGAVWIGNGDSGNAFKGMHAYNFYFKPSSSPRTTSSTATGETWLTNDTPDAGKAQYTMYYFDGSSWTPIVYASGGAGGPSGVSVFTSSGTWNKPSGLSAVRVQLVGGGGGGAQALVGGGGAGGYAEEFLLTSELSSSVTVTVGTGGAAGSGGGSGGNGLTSSFGSYLQATGGTGAIYTSFVGGAPGVGSNGDINLYGGYGGAPSTTTSASGGNGGASYFGGGGYGGMSGNWNASSGLAPGSGGGSAPSTATAGAGRAGIVIVWEYSTAVGTGGGWIQEDSLQTTSATPDSSTTYGIATGDVAWVKITVVGKVNGGTPGNTGAYVRECRAENSGGTVTVYSVSTPFTSEDVSSWDVTLVGSGANVAAQITGQAATTIDWAIKWEVADL